MRFLGKAPLLDDPSTYDATFLLANQRVRGIGFTPVARHNLRFKKRIEQGWHLNVCDPNAPTTSPESNVHKPWPNFEVNDFLELIQKAAQMWNIDLGDLRTLVRKKGVRSLFDDGMERVVRGVTTYEEVLRVAGGSMD